jgi:quercetin dioxygenase-like cupin family protein
MMKFTKTSISDIPIENAHCGAGSRQMLIQPDQVESQYFEAVTKGFLPSGQMFDWHIHEDTDEVFIVTQGRGVFSCEDQVTGYKAGDVVTVGANLKHKIEAQGDETTEGFFIRVRTK